MRLDVQITDGTCKLHPPNKLHPPKFLERAQLVARLRALDVVVGLVGSFCPEPAFEQVATSQGLMSLRQLLYGAVLEQAGLINAGPIPSRPRKLAEELLSLLR
jgi:hypothetical protein